MESDFTKLLADIIAIEEPLPVEYYRQTRENKSFQRICQSLLQVFLNADGDYDGNWMLGRSSLRR